MTPLHPALPWSWRVTRSASPIGQLIGIMPSASPWSAKARLLGSDRLGICKARYFSTRTSRTRCPVLVHALSGPRMPPPSLEVSPRTVHSRPSRTAKLYFLVAVSASLVAWQYPALARDVSVMSCIRAAYFPCCHRASHLATRFFISLALMHPCLRRRMHAMRISGRSEFHLQCTPWSLEAIRLTTSAPIFHWGGR